jgi:hypothetical protein
LTAFTMPGHRPADIASCFLTYSFFRGGVVSSHAQPQHGRPGLRIYIPQRQGRPAMPLDTG